jgi:flagellar hook protein FlgE
MSLFGMLGTAISGLSAQSNKLGTVADNIANANTTGYKLATTQFATLLGDDTAGSYTSGGVQTQVRYNIDQQGNLESTSSVTDLGIKGSGFMIVQGPGDQIALTRAGSFVPDANGDLVNSAGYYLMGYAAGSSASAQSSLSSLVRVNADIGQLQAKPSSTGVFTANFPSDAVIVPAASLPSTNSATATYTAKSSITAYDDLGKAVNLDTYVTKTAGSTWEVAVYNQADAAAGGGFPYSSAALATQTLTFDPTTGKLAAASPTSMSIPVPGGQSVQLDMSQMSQFATAYSVSQASADGNSPSQLDHVEISTDGTLTSVYANGVAVPTFQIPLATVASVDNLTPLSGNVYQASLASGPIQISTPGSGGVGSLESSSLEQSTVDLATELTEMIEAQQGYQANSKVLQTGSDLMSVINNLKT